MTLRAAAEPAFDARRVIVSINPRAGARWRSERVNMIQQSLRRAGFDVHVTSDAEELVGLTSGDGAAAGVRAVVSLGGDGTAAFVRNLVPLEIPLLPVPAGTENLLGRYVCQSSDGEAVCRTVADGVVIGLDLGLAGDRYFLMMISAGFDADVIRRLHERRRGNITRIAYLAPTLQAVRSYSYPELQVYCGDAERTSDPPLVCRWMFGFNLPLYACGWRISPAAVATDSLLDVCAFQRGSLISVLRYLWHVTRQRHHELADTVQLRSARFRIEAAGIPDVAYQLDGDWGGMLPVDVSVLPGELRLLVSREVAVRIGFRLPANQAAAAEASPRPTNGDHGPARHPAPEIESSNAGNWKAER